MTWRQGFSFSYAAVMLVLAFAPIVMARRLRLDNAYQRHIMSAQAICLTLFAVSLVLAVGPWDLSRWNSWMFAGYILVLVGALLVYRRAAGAKRAAQGERSAPTV